MLVGRRPSQLSGHQNHEKNQKCYNLRTYPVSYHAELATATRDLRFPSLRTPNRIDLLHTRDDDRQTKSRDPLSSRLSK